MTLTYRDRGTSGTQFIRAPAAPSLSALFGRQCSRPIRAANDGSGNGRREVAGLPPPLNRGEPPKEKTRLEGWSRRVI
jgi:hypothetical protein